MMSHHHQHPYRPSFDGGGDSSGPEKLSSNVYSDAIVSGGAPVVRSLQPFDISINSPGGMETTLGYPFTWAQWKELEMQAIIYKYLVSAISVPPDLLLSICTNSSGASYTNTLGQRYTNIRDLEPGRCKRTDGKKWRCSRYVAPNQKYCERHMHRGRPRSRKHVEVHGDVNNKKTRLQPAPLESTPVIVPIPKPAGQIINSPSTKQTCTSTFQQIQGPLFCHDKIGENISNDPFFNELHRNSGWMMEGELVAKADAGQQWQHFIDSNSGVSADVRVHPDLQHGYREESLNLLACRDLERTGEDVSVKHNGEFNFMINPELVSMGKQSVKEAPRDLINAWSSLWPSQGNISPSSLTLSIAMAAGDALDEDMGCDSRFMNANQHKFRENGWVPFASEGPLAELLHPSSSYTSNGDSN